MTVESEFKVETRPDIEKNTKVTFIFIFYFFSDFRYVVLFLSLLFIPRNPLINPKQPMYC